MSISLAAIAIQAAAERAARHAADPGAAAAERAAARQALALHPHSQPFEPTLARLIAREIAQRHPINWHALAPAYFMLFVDHPALTSFTALVDDDAVAATLDSLPDSVREELSRIHRRRRIPRTERALVIASISLRGDVYCFVHEAAPLTDD